MNANTAHYGNVLQLETQKDLHILQSWGYLKDLFAAFSTPCGII